MTSELQNPYFDPSESWTQVKEGEEVKGIEDSGGDGGETVHQKKKLEKRMWWRHMDKSRKKEREKCRACQSCSPSG